VADAEATGSVVELAVASAVVTGALVCAVAGFASPEAAEVVVAEAAGEGSFLGDPPSPQAVSNENNENVKYRSFIVGPA
jgi:hypothetical protein